MRHLCHCLDPTRVKFEDISVIIINTVISLHYNTMDNFKSNILPSDDSKPRQNLQAADSRGCLLGHMDVLFMAKNCRALI